MRTQRFERDCYLKTGWLPMQPLARQLTVGDVCHLRQGRLQPLLNLSDAHLIERMAVSEPLELDPARWCFSQGAQQVFCETLWSESEEGEQRAFTKQVVEIAEAGGYAFSAAVVQARLLTNWSQVRDDVTLKLTQSRYGLRDVCVVTGVARAQEWGLATAAQPGARLEISTALDDSDPHRLLRHASSRLRQSQGATAFEHAQGRAGYFFKARKLVLSDAAHDRYLGSLLENPDGLRPLELAHWLDTSLLDLARSNELNLNSAIDFFAWAPLSQDDIERMAD